MAAHSFHPQTRLLMGPGPSDTHERVRQAMARPTLGYLDPDFLGLMDEIVVLLCQAFRTGNEVALPLTGPGSLAMETAAVNLLEPGDEVIVCRNGIFAGRFREIAERAGARTVMVEGEWGRSFDPQLLRRAVQEHPRARAVFFVHAETSTCALNDAPTLGAIAREAGMLTIVDAVTSFAGNRLEVDEWEFDVTFSASQKCLSCAPGLAPITFSPKAMQRVRERRVPVQSWMMAIELVHGYWTPGPKRSYHSTPPVNGLYGLHEALLMLLEEGLEAVWARTERSHLQLRTGLEALGLELAVPEGERTPQLTAVRIPRGVDDQAIRLRMLREHGVEIGAGLGPLAGKIWRIGVMGESGRAEKVERCLEALGHELRIASREARTAVASGSHSGVRDS